MINGVSWIFIDRRNYRLAGGAADRYGSGGCAGCRIVLRDSRGECRRSRKIGVPTDHVAGLSLGEAASVEGQGTSRDETQGRVVVGESPGRLVQLEIGQPAVDKGVG